MSELRWCLSKNVWKWNCGAISYVTCTHDSMVQPVTFTHISQITLTCASFNPHFITRLGTLHHMIVAMPYFDSTPIWTPRCFFQKFPHTLDWGSLPEIIQQWMDISSTMSAAHLMTTWSWNCIPTVAQHAWATRVTPITNDTRSLQLKTGLSGCTSYLVDTQATQQPKWPFPMSTWTWTTWPQPAGRGCEPEGWVEGGARGWSGSWW